MNIQVFKVRFSDQESSSGEEDAYTESSFQDVFNEDGIVLDPVSVLPLQYKITSNLLPLSGGNMGMCSVVLMNSSVLY